MAIAALTLLLAALHPRAAQASPPLQVDATDLTDTHSSYTNCRFGIGGGVSGYDVAALNVGWYMDWSAQASPARPGGAEYAQLILVEPDPDLIRPYVFSPETATLQTIAAANPGSIWLIGNEPDGVLGRLLPEVYAEAYHHLYYLIKQHDPSGQIGAGNIVQPTPLRFEYLDRFLAAYQQNYGGLPPVDVWSIHSYILREISAADPEAYPQGPYDVWGAYIPPGITATRGILYKRYDMFSLSIFRQRLIDFRMWMRDRGYRDASLYITEYGELFGYPPYQGFTWDDEAGGWITEDRVAAFMTGTFDVLLNAVDPALGHPADSNRLVQRWLWYSVSDTGYGGNLFDPNSRELSLLGGVYRSYVQSIPPQVDLLAVRVRADPPVISATGQLQTTTLKATISNIGNLSLTTPITVVFYAGWPPTGTRIGSPQVITRGLDGCADQAEVRITWPRLGAGAHPMYVEIDPGQVLSETTRANNQATGFFLVATRRAFLPVAQQN